MKKILFLKFGLLMSFVINAQEITSPNKNIKVVVSMKSIG
jgi:hypothetical protein